MANVPGNNVKDTEIADPRWKDLYTIGGISCIILVLMIPLAIIAFFIWPYQPGFTSVENTFTTLHNDRFGGLISLDLFMIGAELLMIPITLALYVALKQVNESYALIALVLGLMAIVLILDARPVEEIAYLSDKYAAATTDLARGQYLSAGEALMAHFNGTAWIFYTIFTTASSLISSLLMLRSHIFSKVTAYIGISLTIGIGVFIPVIGIPLSLLATIGGVIWYILIARRLLQLGMGKKLRSSSTEVEDRQSQR